MSRDDRSYVLAHFRDSEIDRLKLQHEATRQAMNKQLLVSEIRRGLGVTGAGTRILDSGAADGELSVVQQVLPLCLRNRKRCCDPEPFPTGTWMRAVQAELPEATFVGADITTSFFPKEPLPGISFIPQDITQPWPSDLIGVFDLVHQRYILAMVSSRLEDVIRGLIGLIKPGGWLQLVDGDLCDHRGNGPAMTQWQQMIEELTRLGGGVPHFAQILPDMLRDRGMIRVETQLVKVANGVTNEDRDLGLAYSRSMGLALNAVIGGLRSMGGDRLACKPRRSSRLLRSTGSTKFSPKDLDTIVDRYKEEMRTEGGYYPLRVIWCQKPLA